MKPHFSSHLLRLLPLLVFVTPLLFSSACSSHKPVPLGTIPTATKPSKTLVDHTVYSVAVNEAKEGRKLHQGCKFYKRTKRILDKLTDGIGAPRGTWPVYMIGGNIPPNAGAVNKSVIIVHESLLVRSRNETDVATVLAHEIGHVLAQHGPDEDQDSKVSASQVGSTLLGVAATIGGAFAGIDASSAQQIGSLASDASSVVSTGLILQYDRDQEYEADEIGLMIMGKAGYDPRKAIDFWKNSATIFGSSNSIGFLSTHPSDSSRADRLEKALPIALKYYRGEEPSSAQQAKSVK